MGYCYDSGGLLCCDVCSNSGGVRKHRCPFGWCQAIALCSHCLEEQRYLLSKECHRGRGCEKASKKYKADLLERHNLITAGHCVRYSALAHGEHVKVLFTGDNGNIAFLMAHPTYDAIPLLTNATPGDYAAIGSIVAAKNADLRDPA